VQWDGKKTLVALTKLKLLYPAQLSGQSGRWQKMLSETLRLLALLSKASPPSNLGLTHNGLLHGLPLNQKELREAARDLSHAMNNLINLMTEEVCVCALGWAARGPIAWVCDTVKSDFRQWLLGLDT